MRDRESREPLVPFNATGEAAAPIGKIMKAGMDRGLYLMTHWNVIIVAPPLTITREELDEGLGRARRGARDRRRARAVARAEKQEPPIRKIRIEAPTTSTADQLVRDLVPFARTDLVPLPDERWEVLVNESSREELDAVLHAVARWAADCGLEDASVLVDGRPVDLPNPD